MSITKFKFLINKVIFSSSFVEAECFHWLDKNGIKVSKKLVYNPDDDSNTAEVLGVKSQLQHQPDLSNDEFTIPFSNGVTLVCKLTRKAMTNRIRKPKNKDLIHQSCDSECPLQQQE